MGTQSEIGEELKIAAGFLDLPVTLNGKKLQGGLVKGGNPGHVPSPGGIALESLSSRFQEEQRTAAGLSIKARVHTREAECCYLTRPGKNGQIVLNWIRNGVVLKRQSTPAQGRADVELLLPFDTDRADISGFDFETSPTSVQLMDKFTPLATNLEVGGRKATTGGSQAPRSTKTIKYLFLPVVWLMTIANYLVLFFALCVGLIAINDFQYKGFSGIISHILGIAGLLIPSFVLARLKYWVEEPDTQPETDQPAHIPQAAVLPLSERAWSSCFG